MKFTPASRAGVFVSSKKKSDPSIKVSGSSVEMNDRHKVQLYAMVKVYGIREIIRVLKIAARAGKIPTQPSHRALSVGLNITEGEMDRLKKTTSISDWHRACAYIRSLRSDSYPADWKERVFDSGFITEVAKNWQD